MGSVPADPLGAPRPEGQAGAARWGSKSFLLVWADTAEPVRLTPSVLLAHLILCSRRVSVAGRSTTYQSQLSDHRLSEKAADSQPLTDVC